MKRKIIIPIIAFVAVLTILFVPIPSGTYKDGGTKEYTALTYKIVRWKRYGENIADNDGRYEKTRIYFFPNNFKSIDSLWEKEAENVEYTFTARVTSVSGNIVTVQPLQDGGMSSLYSFSFSELEDIEIGTGDTVEITYRGSAAETYPLQIHAVNWTLISSAGTNGEFTGTWIHKERCPVDCEKTGADLRISKIYSDCFFADHISAAPTQVKINGTLSDEWCVGDLVFVKFENYLYDEITDRAEADLISVEKSSVAELTYAKPVIYLYPEKETDVNVKLTLDGKITCTYPEYGDGWQVSAAPDGTLTDNDGKKYNYLYWEGETIAEYDFSKGFCVKGCDTAEFLEDALAKLGLDRREANEFIVYWLPLMQDNPYNVISFQTDAYTDSAKLDISPAPDTLIRVFMAWYGAEEFTPIEPQVLNAPERSGFAVIEWGGSRVGR